MFITYVTNLKTLVEKCKFGVLTEQLTHDRIIYGIKCDNTER